MSRAGWLAAVGLLLACGPSVAVGGDGESTGSSTATDLPSTTASTSGTPETTDGTTTSSSTSATGTTQSTESTDTSEGGTFIVPPDGSSCFAHCTECDQWAQDCPRGEKCNPWSNDGGDLWNANRCSPIDGTPGQPGDPCTVEGSGFTGVDDCDLDSVCFGVDPVTLEGTCVARCQGSRADPVCEGGTACFFDFDGTILLCLPPCDPLAPACAADEICAATRPGRPFFCQPVPPFSPRILGEPCGGTALCDAGLVCASPLDVPGCEADGCCTPVGDPDAPPMCPLPEQTCIEVPDDPEHCYCGVP